MEKKVFYIYEGSHNYYDTMKLKQKNFERAKQECLHATCQYHRENRSSPINETKL